MRNTYCNKGLVWILLVTLGYLPCLSCEILNKALSATDKSSEDHLNGSSSNTAELHLDPYRTDPTINLHISRAEYIRIMQCTYLIRSSSWTWLVSGIQDETSVDSSVMDSSIESSLWACRSITSSVSVVSWWISLAWLLETCLWIDDGSLNDCPQQSQRTGEVFSQVGGNFLEATNAANV